MNDQLYRLDTDDFAGRCNHGITTEDYERAIETCKECPAVLRWMVPIEPTDRICIEHYGFDTEFDASQCLHNDMDNRCVWVDVVRVDPDE